MAIEKNFNTLVEEELLANVNKRAFYICSLYALTFALFGFTSTRFLKQYFENLTLWQNLWPRLLFNTLPLVLASLYLRFNTSGGQVTKALIWIILFPMMFSSASLIYTWPLIISDKQDVFLYMHATHIYAVSIIYIIIAPPLRLMILLTGLLVIFFWGPLAILLSSNKVLFSLFLNDTLFACIINIISCQIMYKLRLQVATANEIKKSNASKFLGGEVSNAVFGMNMEKLADKVHNGILLETDIRGYTIFTNAHTGSNNDIVNLFTKEYFHNIAKIVAKYGGYIHKTQGDSHLISFGIVDDGVDDGDDDVETSEAARLTLHAKAAMQAMDEIPPMMDQLLDKYNITENLRVCGAIVSGTLKTRLVGDDQRLEWDLHGDLVITATRLEEYTKWFCKSISDKLSYLVFTKEFYQLLEVQDENLYTKFETIENPIRDRLDIKYIYLKQYSTRY